MSTARRGRVVDVAGLRGPPARCGTATCCRSPTPSVLAARSAPSLKSVVYVDASMFAALVLALGGLTSSPLGTLLVALVAITAIVLVGRFVLSVAWKLLLVATGLVAAAWAVTTLLG